jgi:hypothetical protein
MTTWFALMQECWSAKACANRMVYLRARVIGIGIDKADMLAQEILSRNPGRPSSRVCRSKNPDPSQGGRGFFLPACFRRPTNRL